MSVAANRSLIASVDSCRSSDSEGTTGRRRGAGVDAVMDEATCAVHAGVTGARSGTSRQPAAIAPQRVGRHRRCHVTAAPMPPAVHVGDVFEHRVLRSERPSARRPPISYVATGGAAPRRTSHKFAWTQTLRSRRSSVPAAGRCRRPPKPCLPWLKKPSIFPRHSNDLRMNVVHQPVDDELPQSDQFGQYGSSAAFGSAGLEHMRLVPQ